MEDPQVLSSKINNFAEEKDTKNIFYIHQFLNIVKELREKKVFGKMIYSTSSLWDSVDYKFDKYEFDEGSFSKYTKEGHKSENSINKNKKGISKKDCFYI